MKRRKAIYDYSKHYDNDRFQGWAVWRVYSDHRPRRLIAVFFCRKARGYAQDFTKGLNMGATE